MIGEFRKLLTTPGNEALITELRTRHFLLAEHGVGVGGWWMLPLLLLQSLTPQLPESPQLSAAATGATREGGTISIYQKMREKEHLVFFWSLSLATGN